MDSYMELCPVSEDDLALLQRLYSDPLAVGEHEWHGWQDTRWLRREWAENGLLAEDRGTLMARKVTTPSGSRPGADGPMVRIRLAGSSASG